MSVLRLSQAAERARAGGLAGQALALLEGMRPMQWQKNLLLFAALIFSSGRYWHVADPASWLPLLGLSITGFALFSLAASGSYLVNDVLDIERDRLHPRKQLRPVASGRLPVPLAVTAGIVLMAGSVLAA